MRNPENDSSTTIVIFGASGDLTQRKLVPALFHLYRKERLPADTRIVGFARRPYSHEEFRARLREGMEKFASGTFDAEMWERFAPHLRYVRGDLNTPADFEKLRASLAEIETGPANRLYYLATAPSFYRPVIEQLGATGLAQEIEGWRRVVIEKPFGHDLASAQELNHAVHAVFDERQVFRIDHYLGKETAQNILFFRFGNTVFEPVWNRNHVDHVQITVAETVDVGHRGGYYDTAGVLRDMFQNHLLQLMSLVAMEPPASFDADAVRNEKVKLFSAVRPISPEDVADNTVRAQYRGYREAPGVAPDSQTATYAALRLFVDNWRWHGVPFYLRSGKALAAKTSEVIIQFRCPPHIMFPLPPGKEITPNMLALCIQPDEGMHLRFEVKIPDTLAETRSVNMEFQYSDAFGSDAIPDAYERLLLDALQGDASLFTRSDGIELSWKIIDPILQGWESPAAPPLATYEPGGWGPKEADDFMARDGRAWLRGCGGHNGET
jgi:glucose-6-phosphate 1-dehydrogenase